MDVGVSELKERTVDIGTPVWVAWRLLKENSIKAIPVVHMGKVQGIICLRDLELASGTKGGELCDVERVMDTSFYVVSELDSLIESVRSLVASGARYLVVVDHERNFLGVLTGSDLVRFLLEICPMDGSIKIGLIIKRRY